MTSVKAVMGDARSVGTERSAPIAAAEVAIAHDMWEDREFLEETEPGHVPPVPKP